MTLNQRNDLATELEENHLPRSLSQAKIDLKQQVKNILHKSCLAKDKKRQVKETDLIWDISS